MEQVRQAELQFQLKLLTESLTRRQRQLRQLETSLEKVKHTVESTRSADELRKCTETINFLKELLTEEQCKVRQLNKSLEEAKRVTNTRFYKDYHLKSVKHNKIQGQKHKHLSSPALTTSIPGAVRSNQGQAFTPTPSWTFPSSFDNVVQQSDTGPKMEISHRMDELKKAGEQVIAMMELATEARQKYMKLMKSHNKEEKRVANEKLQKDMKPKMEGSYLARKFSKCIKCIETLKDALMKEQQNRIRLEKLLQESKSVISNKLYTNWLLKKVKGKKIQPPTFVPRKKLAKRKRKHIPPSFTPPGFNSKIEPEMTHEYELPDELPPVTYSIAKVNSWLTRNVSTITSCMPF